MSRRPGLSALPITEGPKHVRLCFVSGIPPMGTERAIAVHLTSTEAVHCVLFRNGDGSRERQFERSYTAIGRTCLSLRGQHVSLECHGFFGSISACVVGLLFLDSRRRCERESLLFYVQESISWASGGSAVVSMHVGVVSTFWDGALKVIFLPASFLKATTS
ncbi:hypothetical protein LZ30DRAFT_339590 [Colletotrichum cereale]|nr:hypothetical protein LZ30DRAFT_339590 [Colletotrichum cereale]